MIKLPIILLLAGSVFAPNASAQTRILGDYEIGTQAGLGYKLPYQAIGVSLEQPWKRFEWQANFKFSPTPKTNATAGHAIGAKTAGLLWLNDRLAARAGVSWSKFYSPAFTKSASHYFAGVVIRDSWGDLPGRLYVDYVFPRGCVWATASNPCSTQSNRLQGPEIMQEFRVWKYARVGIKGGAYHFCDQSNPTRPDLGRTCHWTGTTIGFVRFEWPGAQGKY